MDLGNKKCVVIGSNSNVGAHLISRLKEKKKIFIEVARPKKDIKISNIKSKENNFISCDLSSESDVKNLTEILLKQEIDSIICIAGGYPSMKDDFEEIYFSDSSKLLQTHSLSYMYMLSKIFSELNNISVVYISSTSVFWKSSTSLAYSSAKSHAEHSLLALAKLNLQKKHRLNIVRLSLMEKPFSDKYSDYPYENYEKRKSLMPRGELINYKECTDLITFLISDMSTGINGNILSLDRGESILRNSI